MKPIRPENTLLPLLLLLLVAAIHYTKSISEQKDPQSVARAEWQAMLVDPNVNFQLALESFDRYKSEYGATPEESQQFRDWKRSVRANAELDGRISDPQVYLNELLAFRSDLPRPEVNEDELPPSYPMPRSVRAASTRISLQKPNKENAGAWKSIGYHGNPDRSGNATGSGAAEGVTIDPNNPAIVYAVIRHGGLWKSTDYGNTYIPLTDYFYSPSNTSLGIGKSNSNVLYLANNGLIWYSDDAGMSWEERTNEFSGWPEEVWVDPTDENRVIIASDKGLFLSTNAGMSWAKVLDGIYRELQVTDGWHTLGAAVDGTNGPAELFLSYDKGDTWVKKPITAQPDTVTKSYIAFCDTGSVDQLIIYAFTVRSGNTPSIFTGLFKSTDRGETFTEVKAPGYDYPNGPVSLSGDSVNGYSELMDNYGSVNPGTTSSWVGEFWCDPTNPNNLVTMREKMWYSIDGGQTWRFGPSYGGAGWADRRYCTENPTKDTLYVCDDGGVWAIAFDKLFPYSSSADFISKNGNIAASEGTNLGISTYNKEVFMTGGQDIGQVFQRDGISTHVHWADVYRGRISPVNDSVFWTGGYMAMIEGDTNYTQLYNGVEPDHFDPLRVYGFTKAGVLYRTVKGQDGWAFPKNLCETNSSSAGQSYTTANIEPVDLSSAGVEQWNGWTFEQSRANPELAFIGDERGRRLFKTNNLSADAPTWTEVVGAPSLGRYRIATHPYNEKLIAIGTDNAVWISRDGGSSWSELEGFPASGTVNIFFDRNTQEGLYVSNALTVWYRDETLNNWIEFNRGLPLQKISEMKIAYYPDGDARLFVAKYGRSVWSTPLYSVLNKKPITADFTLHSQARSSLPFYTGDQIKLNDLSMGDVTARTWTITGPDSKTISGNDTIPTFTLSTPGIYSVKLTATGSAGTDSVTKAAFIQVNTRLVDIDSVPVNGEGGAWYLGIKSVTINEQKYSSNGNTNLFYEDLTGHTPYTIQSGDSLNVYIEPAYNDATWGPSYARLYIDSDNSGSFEEDEVVYAKDDGRLQGHTFTVAVPDEMPEETPIRIRVLANRSAAIRDAYMSQVSTGQAEDHVMILKRPVPTITVSAEAITSDSLELTGTYANTDNVIDAGCIVTAFTSNPELTNPGRISATDIGRSDFTVGKGSLPANRTYYVRAYVTDQYGTYYSEVDTIVPPAKVIPLVEGMEPTFNTGTTSWSINGRVHGEGNEIDSIWFELFNGGAVETVPMISPSGARDQWDSISTTLTEVKRHSTYSYRVVAIINGEQYRSAVKTFNSEYGLYLYWTFDEDGETIIDYSGNGRNAPLGSTITRTDDGLGGSALLFDDVNDVTSGGFGDLQPPFTLQFRVNRSSNSSSTYASILSSSATRVDLEASRNTYQLGVMKWGDYDRPSGHTVPLNEWHTYTLVGTTDSVVIYSDGVIDTTLFVPGFVLPLKTIGASGASMIGLLDEVKVYDRALSSSEIADASKRPQNLTFNSINDKSVGDSPSIFTFSTTSNNTPAFSAVEGANLITLGVNGILEFLDTGYVTIRAVVEGDENFHADSIDQRFRITSSGSSPVIETEIESVKSLAILPNPASMGTSMTFIVEKEYRNGTISIFDPTGNLIQELYLRNNSDKMSVTWNLRNRFDTPVTTGSYLAVIKTTDFSGKTYVSRKMIGIRK